MKVLHRTFLVWIILLQWVIANPLPDSTLGMQEAGNPSIGGLILRTVVTLFLIIGLIFALVFLLKKYFRQQLPGMKNTPWLEIVGRVAVGPRQSLMLVKSFDRILLLGITEQNIQQIAEFPADANIQRQLEEMSQQAPEGKFWQIFKNKMES